MFDIVCVKLECNNRFLLQYSVFLLGNKTIDTVKLFLLILTFFTIQHSTAQLQAFSTAEGAAKFVTGGRGNTTTAPTIMVVTRLDDPTPITTLVPGTFRHACLNNSPSTPNRIIVFRVSGTIRLNGPISMNRANTTIAGQTAPGDGICIADYPVTINADNMIIRYLRFRLGDKNQLKTTPTNCGIPITPFASNPSCIPTANASGNDDAFGDNGGGKNNIIIDHCSVSWSNDEAFTMYKGNNVTLQWNILSEPLNYSYHVETGDTDYELHGYGGIWGGANATMHHNLLAHCKGRMPRFDGIRNAAAELVDFRNNVIYNWGDYNTNGGEGGKYNVVNNYYKYGPNTNSVTTAGINKRNMLINPYKKTSAPALPYGQYFLNGNYCDNSALVTADNWLGVAYNNGITAPELTAMQMTTAHSVINSINTQTALDAYNEVLSKAGCILPNRDTLDQRIINNVINRTGGIIDVQGNQLAHIAAPSNTPWPTLASYTAQTDADTDGMPDNWEAARTTNTTTFIANGYLSTSGYNNIENYINGDTIVAVGIANTCIEGRKINSNNSGNWLHSRDVNFSTPGNANYTASVDSNQIIASILDNGNFGEFTVSYYKSSTDRIVNSNQYLRRNITITPTNPALITAPVTVRFYFSKAEFDALKAADNSIVTINDVKLIKATDNSCINAMPSLYSVITPMANATFGTYGNGYYLQFQTSSFSTFSVVSNVVVAPIKLSQFLAQKTNATTANLKWTTEQETNNKHFLVQRSVDGVNWNTIATIAAAGNSATQMHYTYNDADAKKGTYYYRLQQVDFDGKSSLSETRKLIFDKKLDVTIYPNPTNALINIKVANENNFTATIFDYLGKKILQQQVINGKLNVENLPAGTYLLQIKTKTNLYNSKLIKQ